MNHMDYVVTGATGNVGGAVARMLLDKGKTVRVVGRSADRLKALAQKGAEVAVASVEDAGTMAKAFQGAKAVFLMIPPNYAAPNVRQYQMRVIESYAQALQSAGVKYTVTLSSVGAHLAQGNGPIGGLHDMEERLSKVPGLNVLNLRPTFFMENTFFNIGLIKQAGINGTPLLPDLAVPMISTRDIAQAAVQALLDLKFQGSSAQELLGQRELSMAEVTRLAGAAIGKPDLKYVQFPYEDARKAMQGMGMSEDVALGMVEMYKGFNDGVIKPVEKRNAQNTTPTRFEDFARDVFAPAFNNN